MKELVQIRDLSMLFPLRSGLLQSRVGEIRALDGVSLDLREGECVALVGESGSGKSTLGRCALALEAPTQGQVLFAGLDLWALAPEELRAMRRDFQMIFQDPVASLNPRWTLGELVSEPLEIHHVVPRSDRNGRVEELLGLVEIPPEMAGQFPHELSGGQRQRVAIARALASQPRFLVADEPVSALDASVRGQIMNLLTDLKTRLGLTVLLIAHDLTLVEQISDRVAVLYSGKLVEEASTEKVFRDPQHPYTASLLSAIPHLGHRWRDHRIVLDGEPPDPANLPIGCRFHPRCPIAQERCRQDEPRLGELGLGHRVACHFPGDLEWTREVSSDDGTF